MFSWRCFPSVESAPRAYRLKASNAAPLSSTSGGTFPGTAGTCIYIFSLERAIASRCIPSRNFIRIGDCPKSCEQLVGSAAKQDGNLAAHNLAAPQQRLRALVASSSQRCFLHPRLILRRNRDSPFSNHTW